MHLNGHSSLEDLIEAHSALDERIDRMQRSPKLAEQDELKGLKRKRCRLKTMIQERRAAQISI